MRPTITALTPYPLLRLWRSITLRNYQTYEKNLRTKMTLIITALTHRPSSASLGGLLLKEANVKKEK